MPGPGMFYVDISDLQETIDHMKSCLTPDRAREMMRRTFNDTGRKVKTILGQEVPKKYEAPANWVKSQVDYPRPGGGGEVSVVVPVKGTRGVIGKRFPIARGRGRPPKRRKGVPVVIRAKIVKGQISTLPSKMKHQGGQPPFIAKGVVRTRKYPNRKKPIVTVVGLGVPQMPINRARADVERELKEHLEKRLVHHFGVMMRM